MSPPCLALFDGTCNLCCFWVRFLVRRDPEKKLRFAALQSAAGQEALRRFGLRAEEVTALVFVEGDRHYTKSSAVLHIVRRMKGFWPILFIFAAVPAPVRDFFYDRIAWNRYRWFGRQKACMTPGPDLKDRFLE